VRTTLAPLCDYINRPTFANYENRGYIDDYCRIIAGGEKAVTLPVHCIWYNCFRKAHDLDCLGQLITIAALMSTQDDILTRPYQVSYATDLVQENIGPGIKVPRRLV
jgi:hypothetical protein